MAFNPLQERGIPLDRQVRPWRELAVPPYDKHDVDPYTRCRVITMNGIEVEAVLFGHQFARHNPDLELKRRLAEIRQVEQQQQKAVNWFIPGDESTLEVTLGYEQVAVDLTAWVARMEPDPGLKAAYQFGLLEDFDHLYRYANLYEMLEGRQAERVVDHLTEVMPGRPTMLEHRHPFDNIREPYDKNSADIRSQLHALTITSAEQQTMNFYMTIGNRYMEPIARSLYQEIGMIEEEHVSHYESLMDATATWLEQLVLHEFNECYMYYSFLQQERDPKAKALWELHLAMEIEHLRIACDLLRRHEGKEPEQVVGDGDLPEPVRFEPNKDYVREVIANQLDLTTLGTGYVREAHERFQRMQEQVHGGEKPPSERVVDDHRREFGVEYRLETEGPHPAESLRAKPLTPAG